MSLFDPIQRREFLLQGSAAATVGVTGFHAAGADANQPNQDDASPELLEKFVGQEFAVTTEGGGHGRQSARLVLREVKSHKHVSDRDRPAHVRREAFSLLFEPLDNAKLDDGIHRVQHGKLGSEDIFLSKTVRGQKQREHFVAVFN